MRDRGDSVASTLSGIKYVEEASVVLSIMYGLLVVVLAVVFKVSESISTLLNTAVAKSNISKNYLCVLFGISLMWLACFKIHSIWRRKQNASQVYKSPHASNKWLKAIVAIFGFSVVVKESLEVIGVTEIHNPKCESKFLYFITPIFHSLFALGQVIFLFFYAKIHIQDFTFMSRIGIMHAMASNLAVWISIVSDETNHALEYERFHHNHSKMKGELATLNRTKLLLVQEAEEKGCNVTEKILSIFHDAENTTEYIEGLFKGDCFCHSPVCSLVARADQFLSPMLIEFCLIASCLLYVTWSNVGREVKHHPIITKPSYKFYKSYKGVMTGTLILLGSVIVMTLLASIDSGIHNDMKSYNTEYKSLFIYDTFLTLCNIIILLACIAGFYMFTIVHASKREDFQAGLDVVLLFICLIGPLLVDLFSVLSLSAGPEETKRGRWEMSLASSITDIVVSIVQILFIIYGFSREPSTFSLSNKTKSSPTSCISEKTNSYDNLKKTERVKMVANHHGNNHHDPNENMVELEEMKPGREESGGSSPTKSLSSQPGTNPAIKVSEWEDSREDYSSNADGMFETHLDGNQLLRTPQTMAPRNSRTVNTLEQRSVPRKKRIVLRDIMMFLVISNSCLWMLLSLNGTAYKVYSYQSEYFGHSAWTTLASVTAPLTIFLKLHFAACFFEIWSYS